MNIIYIAYSCNPFNGSEDQIGWNIPFINAQNNSENEIFVITKKEQRESIESYFRKNKITQSNIHFYYVDISEIYKNLFSGFLYSGRLNIWHAKALSVVKKICKYNKIDIIHQLTPIEFRAIGKYYKIKNIKYVVGPIGGGMKTPESLQSYVKFKMIEKTRDIINRIYTTRNEIIKIEEKCDYILYSNYETASISKTEKKDIYTEIGINKRNILEENEVENRKNDKIIFLVVGRLVYQKGHELLFDAIENIPRHYKYEVRIIGNGPEKESLEKRIMESDNLKEHVKIIGEIPYEVMDDEYKNGNILVLPSIRENTGTVILEALARGIPVVAYHGFGAKVIIDKRCGYLYYGKNKTEVIHDLSTKMIKCIENKKILKEKSLDALRVAKENSWEEKINYYNNIYVMLMKN